AIAPRGQMPYIAGNPTPGTQNMPKLFLAPAELRAILGALTEAPSRSPSVETAITKIREALDLATRQHDREELARTRRENRELEAHMAATLRRQQEERDRNAELYEAWNDLEPTHCRNGHN